MPWHLIAFAPAYNVASTIGELIGRTKAMAKPLKKVNVSLDALLILNDGSTDLTSEALKDSAKKSKFMRFMDKPRNEGPVRTLFEAMEDAVRIAEERGFGGDNTILVRMDADLEHQPEDLVRLVEPIASGKTRMTVGYIPFDERNGKEYAEFNTRAGGEESVKFLGAVIPQFCPGFQAYRLDFFRLIYGDLLAKARKFKQETGEEMLAMDFVLLVLAKKAGWEPEIIKLTPIQDKRIKKVPPEKMEYYQKSHERVMEWLGKEYPG